LIYLFIFGYPYDIDESIYRTCCHLRSVEQFMPQLFLIGYNGITSSEDDNKDGTVSDAMGKSNCLQSTDLSLSWKWTAGVYIPKKVKTN